MKPMILVTDEVSAILAAMDKKRTSQIHGGCNANCYERTLPRNLLDYGESRPVYQHVFPKQYALNSQQKIL